jgi:hypothetical protein
MVPGVDIEHIDARDLLASTALTEAAEQARIPEDEHAAAHVPRVMSYERSGRPLDGRTATARAVHGASSRRRHPPTHCKRSASHARAQLRHVNSLTCTTL